MIANLVKRAARGFTLIEVLVSSAVLSIVLAVMFAALSTSMSLWRSTDNKIIADREARAVEMMLVRDLSSVVMPAATNFWPRVARFGRDYHLQFLTAVPSGYQTNPSDGGDVCYVEYAVLPSTNGVGLEMRRLFWPSSQTYSNIIRSNSFPRVRQPTAQYQVLGLSLLPTNSMAARGLGKLVSEVNNTNFILLGTNMLPLTGTLSATNYPVAIEINFAVADPETLANTNVTSRPNYVLRNAGLYSFRIPLPKPPNAP